MLRAIESVANLSPITIGFLLLTFFASWLMGLEYGAAYASDPMVAIADEPDDIQDWRSIRSKLDENVSDNTAMASSVLTDLTIGFLFDGIEWHIDAGIEYGKKYPASARVFLEYGRPLSVVQVVGLLALQAHVIRRGPPE